MISPYDLLKFPIQLIRSSDLHRDWERPLRRSSREVTEYLRRYFPDLPAKPAPLRFRNSQILKSYPQTLLFSSWGRYRGTIVQGLLDRNNYEIEELNLRDTLSFRFGKNCRNGPRAGDVLVPSVPKLRSQTRYWGSCGNDNLNIWSMMSAQALINVDLRGRTVLDLGSADGLQGLLALVIGGAERVIAVEKVAGYWTHLRENLIANGISPNRVRFIAADITSVDEVCRRIGKLERAEIDVVIANLGRWYGLADLVAARYASRYLPSVDVFVGSGYRCDLEDHQIGPGLALELLRYEGGFSTWQPVMTEGKEGMAFLVSR